MIIQIWNLDNNIVIDDAHVNILEIENKCLFLKIIEGFYNISIGKESELIISFFRCDEKVELYNEVACYIDIFNVDVNSKRTLSYIYNIIGKNIENDIGVMDLIKEQSKLLCCKFGDEINSFDINLCYDSNFKVSDFLKIIDLKINIDVNTTLDRIFRILDVESLLKQHKLVIFVNIKTFFSDSEMEKIYKYSKHKQVYILIIESKSSGVSLQYENKIIVDNDLNEIVLCN